MPYRDFRQFLDVLREQGELIEIDRYVDPRLDVAKVLKRSYVQGGPAIVFTDTGADFRLVGGVYSTRRKALLAFEATEDDILEQVLHGLDYPIAPTLTDAPAPCQEVVLTGEQIDVTRFPIPTWSPDDGGPFITAALTVSKDPQTGIPDFGHYRYMVIDKSSLAFSAQPFHRFGKHIVKSQKMGRTQEAAIILGVDPVLAYASQVQVPDDTNDWYVAGGLRGAPVELVACKTIDVEVPATAEVVIEIEADPNRLVMEGPLGEYTGYYTPAAEKPLARIKAITHRRDAFMQGLLTGKPLTENHILKQMSWEASFYRTIKQQFPTVRKVAMPPSGGVSFWTIVQMEPRYDGEARQVILAAMASNQRPKWTIVVEPDIDVHDSSEVEWAMAMRVEPHRDVIVVDALPAGPADPTILHEKVRTKRINSAIGVDATRRFGVPFPKTADVPNWQDFAVPELDGRPAKPPTSAISGTRLADSPARAPGSSS